MKRWASIIPDVFALMSTHEHFLEGKAAKLKMGVVRAKVWEVERMQGAGWV